MKSPTVNLFYFIISFLSISFCNSQELIKIEKVDSFSVYFEFGSDKISDTKFLQMQLDNKDFDSRCRFRICSYTDSVGTIMYNKKLASKRLLKVYEVLKSSKMNNLNIDTLNLNESRTDAKTLLDSLNRRVDIVVTRIVPVFKLNSPTVLKINFRPGDDRLLPISYPEIEKLILVAKMDTTLKIKLNGHVCCTNDKEISLKRALRVQKYLVTNGVDINRIKCEGFGNKYPLVSGSDEKSNALNRRVEVVLSK